ncbi:MAG: tetratricopeptide repeat protein, partial [Acidobacteriota bacterium]
LSDVVSTVPENLLAARLLREAGGEVPEPKPAAATAEMRSPGERKTGSAPEESPHVGDREDQASGAAARSIAVEPDLSSGCSDAVWAPDPDLDGEPLADPPPVASTTGWAPEPEEPAAAPFHTVRLTRDEIEQHLGRQAGQDRNDIEEEREAVGDEGYGTSYPSSASPVDGPDPVASDAADDTAADFSPDAREAAPAGAEEPPSSGDEEMPPAGVPEPQVAAAEEMVPVGVDGSPVGGATEPPAVTADELHASDAATTSPSDGMASTPDGEKVPLAGAMVADGPDAAFLPEAQEAEPADARDSQLGESEEMSQLGEAEEMLPDAVNEEMSPVTVDEPPAAGAAEFSAVDADEPWMAGAGDMSRADEDEPQAAAGGAAPDREDSLLHQAEAVSTEGSSSQVDDTSSGPPVETEEALFDMAGQTEVSSSTPAPDRGGDMSPAVAPAGEPGIDSVIHDHDVGNVATADLSRLLKLARLYRRQGELDRAARVYRDLLDLDPYHGEARRELAELCGEGLAEINADDIVDTGVVPGVPIPRARMETLGDVRRRRVEFLKSWLDHIRAEG